MSAGPLAALLLDEAADRPVAFSGGHVVDLRRFRADVAAAVAGLAAVGCRRGLVACDDAYWATVGLFALAHCGAETVLPPNLLPATLTALAGAFDHIVTDGAIQGADRTLMLAPGDGRVSGLPAMDAERTCVTLFTSGSTGTPKRFSKTVRQLELEAETVERVLGQAVPKAAWVHATVVHQHLYGLTFRLCWPLATHRVFFGHTHQFWEPLLAVLQTDSVLVSSPSHLSRLGGLAPLSPERRPSAVLSGGSPLPDSAADATLAVLGCAAREMFGSTETGVIATRLRAGGGQPPWQPMPGVTVTRLDDGRLHVHSPYVGNADGEVCSDLIELDGDGGFSLRGRVDRVVKIEGVRVSLTELDMRLAELEGVAQAAVAVLGESVPYLGGVVVLDAAGTKQLATCGVFRLGRRLRHDLSLKLPSAALPRRWRFVAQLPTGPLGKTSAADLGALFDASCKGQAEV
jgi:acyl-coenzyme A synthetase/AMP-(fatty) acid ligase